MVSISVLLNRHRDHHRPKNEYAEVPNRILMSWGSSMMNLRGEYSLSAELNRRVETRKYDRLMPGAQCVHTMDFFRTTSWKMILASHRTRQAMVNLSDKETSYES